ncbi:MAG: hypothetical protein ABIP85_17160 [Chthoniobacteraceae bacterium]
MIPPGFGGSSVMQHVESIARAEARRPDGMVDWMHFGLLIGCGWSEPETRAETDWRSLNDLQAEFGEQDSEAIAALFEQRAWTAGS